MRFTWLGNYYTVIFMSDLQRVYVNIISEAIYDAKHLAVRWKNRQIYIWAAAPAKPFCINVHSLLPAHVFLVQNWKRVPFSSSSCFGWNWTGVPFFALCLDLVSFWIWGHRHAGKVINSPHWIDLSFIHFNSSHTRWGEVPKNIPFWKPYWTSFNLFGGCEQIGSSLLL